MTGQRFEILYGPDGRRLILSVDGKQPPAGEVGDVLHSGELGSPAHYEIRGGKIVTTISGTPFEITRVQGRRQVRCGAQQRVRLRQLRGRVEHRGVFAEALAARAACCISWSPALLLFAAYRMLHPELSGTTELNRIEVTADDLRQLEVAWTAQWHRPPTPDEMRGLVEGRVREEILYREALALGLDQGDTIVKRRLAQKMEFLADDVSALRDPTADELRAWYARNSERFAEPGRRSFRHVYFSHGSSRRPGARGRHACARQARTASRPMSPAVGDDR